MQITADDRRRKAYENATTLSQSMLDETFRGGENQIETIGVLTKSLSQVFTVTKASPAVFTSVAHGLVNGDIISLSTTGLLYAGLSTSVSYYIINKTDDTYQASLTSGGTAVNTSGSQSGTHTWTRTWTLRFADRPKYVGDNFYEGRASFPQVKRTIGELQSPALQFSQFQLVLANMDGFYDSYLPSGDSYFSFIGASLEISIGLRDVSGSFISIFQGTVPDQGGFEIDRQSITIRATDKFDALNIVPNLPYINLTDFPSATDDVLGKIIPFVLGDWEAGFDVTDNASTVNVDVSGSQTAVFVAAPNAFYGGVIGYYVGGGYFLFSIGSYTPDNASALYIKRGDALIQTNFTAAPNPGAGYWQIGISSLQGSPSGTVPYAYQSGDVAVIKIKVPYTGTSYSNIIQIAEELLLTLGMLDVSDLDSTSWSYYKTKSSPASADFTTLKGRIWIGDNNKTILETTLGFLEQVRIEMFVNRSNKIALRSLHTDEFTAQADLDRIEQVEIAETTIAYKADELTFFNQAQINYGFTPITNKTELATGQKVNQKSVDKSGKRIIKGVDTPWLYVAADVNYQLIEFIRFYSTGFSFVTVDVCWVHLLRELGNFIGFNYDIGAISYDNAPMQIRDFAVNPGNASISLRLLSFANFLYSGYNPSNSARFLSGYNQTIDDV